MLESKHAFIIFLNTLNSIDDKYKQDYINQFVDRQLALLESKKRNDNELIDEVITLYKDYLKGNKKGN